VLARSNISQLLLKICRIHFIDVHMCLVGRMEGVRGAKIWRYKDSSLLLCSHDFTTRDKYIFYGSGGVTLSDGPASRYNFASDDLVFCSTQVVILATNASTSCLVLPACKHTRIRSEPSGTVGGTMGLTTKFFS
jgi:hypothetical protein